MSPSLERIVIDRRFRGPEASGNGGYSCGLVAGFVPGDVVEVTLRAPPPLDARLDVEREGEVVRVRHGEQLVAEGHPAELGELTPPPPPSRAEARIARKGFRGFVDHPFPTCFVCGPQRSEGDGLRIHPGWIGDVQVADVFVPHPSLDAGDGRMRAEHVWAALDCPGAFALMGAGTEDLTLVLGRMAARIDERPRIGEELVVTGWVRGRDGRKHDCGTALWGDDGRLRGLARATWIAIRK
jgi:hypothetical protein